VLDSCARMAEIDEALPRVRGQTAQPDGARGALPGPLDRDVTTLPVAAAEKWFGQFRLRGRDADIARDILPEISSAAAIPETGGARLPLARPLRADTLGRRGAAHPPRFAARIETCAACVTS